jgi:hypothetical protein
MRGEWLTVRKRARAHYFIARRAKCRKSLRFPTLLGLPESPRCERCAKKAEAIEKHVTAHTHEHPLGKGRHFHEPGEQVR